MKKYESDNHTFSVEIDTYKNPKFDDPNDNHTGIDNLACMNSSATFIRTMAMTTANPGIFQQVWIGYFHANSPDGYLHH